MNSHLLVGLQFGAILLGSIPFNAASQNYAYLILTGIGALLGIYTLLHNRFGNFGVYPEIINGARLITSGPYRWVRHPMYLTVVLGMLGLVLFNNHWLNWLSLPILLFALIGKMNKEEGYLRQNFPDYAAYSKSCKRLIPFVY